MATTARVTASLTRLLAPPLALWTHRRTEDGWVPTSLQITGHPLGLVAWVCSGRGYATEIAWDTSAGIKPTRHIHASCMRT